MSTQEKLQDTLLSNEHLQQFIHSSLWKIVLSCNLKQINLTLKPGCTVSLALQTSSVLVLSRFNPRIPVPVGHRWRHNHDGHECLQLILLFSGTDGQNSSQVQRFQDCCGLLPFVHMINDSESELSPSLVGFKFWDRAQTHHHLGVPLISGVRALGPVKIRWQWHVFGKSNSMQ